MHLKSVNQQPKKYSAPKDEGQLIFGEGGREGETEGIIIFNVYFI